MTVALNHRVYGETGPALVVLHGLFGSAKNWHSQAVELATSHRVVCADLRNHGASPHAPAMGYPEMAGDVLELIERLDLERASVLGHSMGGKVAMQLALSHPERIAKLVVVDIAPVAYVRHHDAILEAMQAIDLSAHRTRQSVDAALAPAIGDAGVRQFILTNLKRDGDGYAWQLNLAAIAQDYQRLAAAPAGDPYAGPTLFIKGGRSDYITSAHREPTAALFPAAKVKIINDSGHWPHADNPRLFNRIAADFLRA